MSTGAILAIIAALFVMMGLGTCAVCIGLGAMESKKAAAVAPKVYVQCDGNPTKGYECSVSQTAGVGAANACWDIEVVCENGARLDGHACQTVQMGAKTSRFVSASEMTHSKTCTRAQSTSVVRVTATAM